MTMLVEDLLASLDGVSAPASDTEAAWALEIQRRVDQVNNGTAKLVAAEDMYAETRRLVAAVSAKGGSPRGPAPATP